MMVVHSVTRGWQDICILLGVMGARQPPIPCPTEGCLVISVMLSYRHFSKTYPRKHTPSGAFADRCAPVGRAASPPLPLPGAALRAALSFLPGRSRPAPKRGAARPAPVLLRAVLPPGKASQETAGGLSGVKASALRCAPAGGAWARAGV